MLTCCRDDDFKQVKRHRVGENILRETQHDNQRLFSKPSHRMPNWSQVPITCDRSPQLDMSPSRRKYPL